MKSFDNFKLIEKFRRHFKNDDFEMTFVNDEYGTITCKHKRLMSAGFFYKEYVREYGWAFCDKEAEKSPVITSEFLKLCHFYEWYEKNEMYNLSLIGEMSLREITDKIPDSKCIFDNEGRKRVDIPKGSWSLNKLEELLKSQ